MSVSAEVFGKFNNESYTPPVHKKTLAQEASLRKRMEQNFMFSTLNPKDKKSILDAMNFVNAKAGDYIIK